MPRRRSRRPTGPFVQAKASAPKRPANFELIAGKLPSITMARDRCQYSTVHHSDLPERIGGAGRSADSPTLPTISPKPMRRVEHAFLENPSLIDGRTADDHLNDAGIAWRAPHAGRGFLDFGERTMICNMLGKLLSHARFECAHDPPPDVDLV
jgi:hypothetical protein